jgi:hypothetical protein
MLQSMSVNPNDRHSWVENWSSWLTKNWLEFSYVAVPVVGFALVGIFFGLQKTSWGWISFGGVTLLFVGLIGLRLKQEQSKSSLQGQNDALRDQLKSEQERYALLEEAFNSQIEQGRSNFGFLLRQIAQELRFNSTHRISLYVHNGEGFTAVARYSENPDHNRIGRPFISDGEGVLAISWREGESELLELPDPKSKAEYRKQAGITPTYEKAFKMKSRSYYGRRLSSVDGYQHIGVIVLESTSPKGLSRAETAKTLENHQNSLYHILLGVEQNGKMWGMGL